MNLNNQLLEKLLQSDASGPKISFYHSTHPISTVQNIQEDVIRFKNALQAIRSNKNYDESVLGSTMKSLDELVDNRDFWNHSTLGLAVFADEKGYQTARLNYDVTEAQYLSNQYQISPLVLMESLGSDYFILDINHTRPRLLEGTSAGCSELKVPDMPESLESITGNTEFRKELQHQPGGVGAFHGHNDKAALQDNMMTYYRSIAQAIEAHLAERNDPLILMGVENRVGSLRSFLTYENTLDEYIEGNGESLNENEIQERAQPIVDQYYSQQRRDQVEQFKNTSPELTVVGADLVSSAVAEGRVAKLLMPFYRRTTDTVRDEIEKSIVLQLKDDDTETEQLVRATLAQSGDIVAIALEAFDDESPRAICRF